MKIKRLHRNVFVHLFVVMVFVLCQQTIADTGGKIRGIVKDVQTGESLVGASVVVEGTTLGAATDIDGKFIILNVDVGVHKLRVTYIGYANTEISNVRVSANLTTDLTIEMSSSSVSVNAVEIIRQIPLVDKGATNSVSIVNADNIKVMPVRGVSQVFALSGGVVKQGSDYYVRGGRAEETAFYVDGVLSNNPLTGRLSLSVINNAIEEVQSQIGGMTAEYGNAMSGVVNTTTKVGGSKYSFSAEAITDELLGGKTSKNILGAYSYGLNDYVLTAGGPVVPGYDKIKFFFAGERIFNRSTQTFLDGISFPHVDSSDITVSSTGNESAAYLANLINSSSYSGGRNLGGYANDTWSGSGNVFFDYGLINIKIGGSYNTASSIAAYGRGLSIINVTAGTTRGAKTNSHNGSLYTKFTFTPSKTSFVTLNLSYFDSFSETGDQLWMGDVEKYGDPAYNSILVNNKGIYINPPSFSVYSWSVAYPGSVYNVTNSYSKTRRQNYGARLDYVSQITPSWEFKLGGEATYYTMRSYFVNGLNIYQKRTAFASDSAAGDWNVYSNSSLGAYGYDIYGNDFAGGTFIDKTGRDTVDLSASGPKHPIFVGAYIQNKYEFDDLILNFGIRFDYLDPGTKKYKNVKDIAFSSIDGATMIADSSLIATEATTQISPRLGFSFPVADKSVFHATYGQFIQYGNLNDLYEENPYYSTYLKSGSYAMQHSNPNLKPERTTQYEVGFRQQVSDVSAFDLTFYYKDVKDLHVTQVIYPDNATPYFLVVNGDFGTSKGLTFNYTLRRTNRISANATYTLSKSTATGSSSGTAFDIAWQDNSGSGGTPYFPVIPSLTSFDRTHTGSIDVDYRYDENDGPTVFGEKPLSRVGANFLFTFSSGVRYTRSQVNGAFSFSSTNAPVAYEPFNSSTAPWSYQLDIKLDKTFSLFSTLDANIYLWIENVFNTKNITTVYGGTGLADDDGWFSTEAGKTWLANNGEKARQLYKYLEDVMSNYGTPRSVRLGVEVSL
jgi:outer membrane receptor protein involved in Fe transport